MARRVTVEVGGGLVAVTRGWALREAVAGMGMDEVRFGHRRRRLDDARVLAAELAIARGPCPDEPGRGKRFMWRGLTVMNAVTLAVALGGLGGAPGPGWLSGALAVAATAVQVALAFDLGRLLRPFAGRVTAAGMPPSTVVEAAALVGMGSLAGTVSSQWAMHVHDGGFGVLGGLVTLTSALAAPLLIVHDEVYGPGRHGRALRSCERALARADTRRRRLESRATRMIDRARHRLRRAEELLVLAADLLGEDDPEFAGLAAGVAELRSAIADLTGTRFVPAQLDLAC